MAKAVEVNEEYLTINLSDSRITSVPLEGDPGHRVARYRWHPTLPLPNQDLPGPTRIS